MRIGIVSDLHLNFRNKAGANAILDHIAYHRNDIDVLVNAGDTHPVEGVRRWFRNEVEGLGISYIEVTGNHDYEHSDFENFLFAKEIAGVRFRCATLWTNFGENPMSEMTANAGISDFNMVHGCTTETMKSFHYEAKAFLFSEPSDVIVTHFAIHPLSIAKNRVSDSLTPYFVNNMDNEIYENTSTRLYVHGHTHDNFDYEIYHTRVICNPLGYPFEGNDAKYKMKIVEI